jgi:hypothetical protein
VTKLSTIDYLVLDKMLDDMESIETILSMLNHPEFGNLSENHGRLFTDGEVEASIRRLLTLRLVKRMDWEQPKGPWHIFDSPSANIADDWFDLTEQGRSISLDWQKRQS